LTQAYVGHHLAPTVSDTNAYQMEPTYEVRGTKAKAGGEMTLEAKAAYYAFMRCSSPLENGFGSRVDPHPQPGAPIHPLATIPGHKVVHTDTEEKGDDNSSTVNAEALLERDIAIVKWVKPTAMEKKVLAEKMNKEKREVAGKRCIAEEKLAKISANDTAEQKKMEKSMEQAKRKAVNKDKGTTTKRAGAKKDQAGKKGKATSMRKAVDETTKATRMAGKKADKADGGNIPKGQRLKVATSKVTSKAVSAPKVKKGLSEVPVLKEETSSGTLAREGGK
jgi:hypothetical protein